MKVTKELILDFKLGETTKTGRMYSSENLIDHLLKLMVDGRLFVTMPDDEPQISINFFKIIGRVKMLGLGGDNTVKFTTESVSEDMNNVLNVISKVSLVAKGSVDNNNNVTLDEIIKLIAITSEEKSDRI